MEISQDINIPNNYRVIDGRGLFVMPALFDMHVHIGEENPWNEFRLALFPYFGIQHVNVMTGSDGLIELAELFNNGKNVFGPQITLASELIDGNPPMWGDDHTGPILSDPEEVKQALIDLKNRGYRDMKVYDRLSPEVYLAILEEASMLNLRVVGHVPANLEIEMRLDSRQQRIEHLSGYPELSYNGNLSELPTGYMDRKNSLIDGYCREKMKQAAKSTVEKGIWNTPTHVLYSNLTDSAYIQEIMYSELSDFIDPGLKGFWSMVIDNPDFMLHLRCERFRDVHLDMISILHLNGAKILAGTDGPLPLLMYGRALHEELKYFVQTGFTPFEALKTATTNPAEYLELDKTGKVLPGYKANLLLLSDNPLNNIQNTLKIEAVLMNGIFISREEMRKKLNEIWQNTSKN